MLNRYQATMGDAVLDHGGTVVDYLGDGLMAAFGAPIETVDHADRALAAARSMAFERLADFNGWLGSEGIDATFGMGIGLNSGRVMSGTLRLGAALRLRGDRRHHQHGRRGSSSSRSRPVT